MNGWTGSKYSINNVLNYINQCITTDISSFVHWYYFTYTLTEKFMEFANKLYSSLFSIN